MKYSLYLTLAPGTLHDLGGDAPRRHALLADLEAAGLLGGLTHLFPERARKGRPVARPVEVRESPGDPFRLADAETLEGATRVAEVQVAFDQVTLEVEGADGERSELERLDSAIDALLGAVQRASVELADWSGVRVLDAAVRHPSPPRDLGVIVVDGVVDVFNVERVEPLPGMAEVLWALESSPPEGAVTARVGRYRVVSWVASSPATRAALEDTLEARIAWYAAQGDFPIRYGYNEQGDRELILFGPVTDPLYTFYVPLTGAGFKALVDLPGDPMEDERIAAMAADLAKGETEQGHRLASVTLIFPTRELALSYRAAALALGFAGTLYPDDEGRFWEPEPAGTDAEMY